MNLGLVGRAANKLPILGYIETMHDEYFQGFRAIRERLTREFDSISDYAEVYAMFIAQLGEIVPIGFDKARLDEFREYNEGLRRDYREQLVRLNEQWERDEYIDDASGNIFADILALPVPRVVDFNGVQGGFPIHHVVDLNLQSLLDKLKELHLRFSGRAKDDFFEYHESLLDFYEKSIDEFKKGGLSKKKFIAQLNDNDLVKNRKISTYLKQNILKTAISTFTQSLQKMTVQHRNREQEYKDTQFDTHLEKEGLMLSTLSNLATILPTSSSRVSYRAARSSEYTEFKKSHADFLREIGRVIVFQHDQQSELPSFDTQLRKIIAASQSNKLATELVNAVDILDPSFDMAYMEKQVEFFSSLKARREKLYTDRVYDSHLSRENDYLQALLFVYSMGRLEVSIASSQSPKS